MADLTISVDIDASGTKRGAAEAKAATRDVANAANRDFKDLQRSVKDWSDASASAFRIFSAGIGAAVAAAALLAATIYKLSKSFADAAIEIGKANKTLGIGVETLSALKMQAERTGTSFASLQEGLTKFTKTIGDANNGSREAGAKLVRLGIDAKRASADIDGALRQALRRILELPPGVQRANAAMDAFGESGAKLLPFIDSFNGDMDRLIETAKEFGQVMSEQDVRAAEDFNDALFDVQMRLREVGLTFGRELMPEAERVLRAIDDSLKKNKDETQSWAETSRAFIHRLISIFGDAVESTGRLRNGTHELSAVYNRFTNDIQYFIPALAAAVYLYERWANAAKVIAQRGQEEINRLPLRAGMGGTAAVTPYFSAPAASRTRSTRPKMSEEEKQFQRMQKMIRDLQLDIEFFGDKTEVASIKQRLLADGVNITTNELAQQAIGLAAQKDRLKEAADEAENAAKLQDDLKKAFRDFNTEIRNGAVDQRVQLGEVFRIQEQQLELGRDLTSVEEQQQKNITELTQKTFEWQRAGMINTQVQELTANLLGEQKETLDRIKTIEDQRTKINANRLSKELQSGLKETLEALNYEYQFGTEVTERYRVEKLLLTEAYKALTPEQRAAALAVADEIDAMRQAIKAQAEMQRQYDKFYGVIRDSLQTLADEGFGGLFRKVKQMFRQFLLDMVAQWISSKFFKMFYQGGNAQAAGAGQQGGGLGGIFQSIFGSGGMGPGGTPVFNGGNNFVSGLGGGGMLPVDAQGNVIVNGNQRGGLGGFLGGLGFKQNMFTGKEMSSNMQMVSGIGTLVAAAGSFIPGRLGNTISMAGMGLSIGAMFGPIGAAVGAGIGALIGLFTGGGASKRDKKEKMPQLEQGFRDALQQLRDLVRDVRTLRVDPASALARATELRSQIAGGFGIQFESGKYRRLAQTQITQRLAEADALIAELRSVSEVSRAAMERQRRLIPEFAGGVYLSPAFQNFRRMNGMIPGIWTGRDTVPAMLARGEMVLNPQQQLRVQQQAGFDVFKDAGIPGYARGGMVQSAPASNEPIMVEVTVSQDASGILRVAANNPQGRRVLLDVVSDGFRNDELKTRRR